MKRADSQFQPTDSVSDSAVAVLVPGQWQWAVAVDVDVVTDTQTQCQLYDYCTTTFHLRRVHRIGVQKASQSLRFVNINLVPCP